MAQNTVSLQLTIANVKDLEVVLSSNGWTEDIVNNEYVALRMRNSKGSVCTLYTSKKVVFQGSEDFSNILGKIKQGCGSNTDENLLPHIGVDEVGKGDYFGPLVIVAFFVDKNISEKLSSLGVGDSKKISDSKILQMYNELRDYEYYYVSVVSPKEYKELNSKYRNVSILLAKQHSKVIEMGLVDLDKKKVKCDYVVIDQFSSKKSRVVDELGSLGKGIEFRQFHKGESDIAVAAASVIARGVFLEEMEKMNERYYFNFPKGASHVIGSAKEFVAKHGVDELDNVAKTSFKTTAKVLQGSF
ncbi:MAG: ribonuclease HIII [Candidatus Dojkabacteria bacterium]